MSSRKPLKWLENATPQEIGEAILAVGHDKGIKVVTYIVGRIGPEALNLAELARDNLEQDPLGAISGALIGLTGRRR